MTRAVCTKLPSTTKPHKQPTKLTSRDDMTQAQHALLIGDFAPLHLGHMQDINHAAQMATTLHIIITPPKANPLPSGRCPTLADVARWVQNACQQFGFVRVHTTASLGLDKLNNLCNFDYQTAHTPPAELPALCQALQLDTSDVVIITKAKQGNLPTDTTNASTANLAQLPSTIVDNLPIATQPLSHFAKLSPACRYFYTQTVCIVGGESSGKTTLVHKLANHYGASVALEMGRLYTHSHLGGSELALQYSDYTPIAIHHAKAIEHACHNATAAITLIDTDFATTQAFCETYENASNPVVASLALDYRMDFTLYLDNNVAWVADGMRRLGGAARSQFAQKLLEILARYRIDYHSIDNPDYRQRYLQAVAWIDRQILAKF
ncbi:multifunctional transcriptional regulator/nicotinamide-nucleotide adenylyltransferase/ribosylnicotinamide kinase NadR [Moraxella cuniculi]|nr:multifunctional transcriptional regulator/nicotinamide-nucleotide adenylyltransferase/ribosylnicotinamide kinase NadR [Moraxella cuniculi]OOS07125.1 trifunctional nicotinamide-nucleotide adenylyltransferase/ribosylnicotinamide kinase/transcriptional regulator NadR [Moraxella cuniculi]